MEPRTLLRSAATLSLLSLIALAAVVTDSNPGEAEHISGMAAMSIDVNVSGNDADTLGANDSCVSVAAGNNVTVDVTALDIPMSQAMIGFGFTMSYDPGAITVGAASAAYLLDLLPGSIVLDASDPAPDADGTYGAGALDSNTSAAEFGSGVLMRLTMGVSSEASAGVYALTLSSAAHIDATDPPSGHAYAPVALNNATIAVGQPCPTVFGDVDCGGGVNSVDALKVLRFNAGLSVAQTDPCVDLGQALPNTELQGDVDCSNAVSSVDALKLLRHGAGLSVSQNEPPPCPDIGI